MLRNLLVVQLSYLDDERSTNLGFFFPLFTFSISFSPELSLRGFLIPLFSLFAKSNKPLVPIARRSSKLS